MFRTREKRHPKATISRPAPSIPTAGPAFIPHETRPLAKTAMNFANLPGQDLGDGRKSHGFANSEEQAKSKKYCETAGQAGGSGGERPHQESASEQQIYVEPVHQPAAQKDECSVGIEECGKQQSEAGMQKDEALP
jgi:hypothetical protein